MEVPAEVLASLRCKAKQDIPGSKVLVTFYGDEGAATIRMPAEQAKQYVVGQQYSIFICEARLVAAVTVQG